MRFCYLLSKDDYHHRLIRIQLGCGSLLGLHNRVYTNYGLNADHLISYTAFEAKSDLQTKDDLVRQEPEAIGQAMQEYTATQSGPLASLGVHTYAYLPLAAEDQKAIKNQLAQAIPEPNVAERNYIPDYREVTKAALLDAKQPSAAYLTAMGQTNYPADLRDASTPLPSPGKFVTFGVMLSQPLSRGSVQM